MSKSQLLHADCGYSGWMDARHGSFRQVDISSSYQPKVHSIVWGMNDSGLVLGYFVAEGGDRTRGLIGYPLPEPDRCVFRLKTSLFPCAGNLPVRAVRAEFGLEST